MAIRWFAGPPRGRGWLFFYRYTTTLDKWLLTLGAGFAVASGVLSPVVPIAIVGRVVDAPDNTQTIATAARDLACTAACLFVVEYVASLFFRYAAERQARRLRSEAFRRLLRLDMAWHDKISTPHKTATLVSTQTIRMIQHAMGESMCQLMFAATQTIAALVFAAHHGARASCVLALLMSVGVTFVITALSAATDSTATRRLKELDALTTTTLSGIRAIASLNVHDKAATTANHLRRLAQSALIKDVVERTALTTLLITALSAAAADTSTPKKSLVQLDMLIEKSDLFYALVGSSAAFVAALKITVLYRPLRDAVHTAQRLFEILKTTPAVNSTSYNIAHPTACKGSIEFKDVQWAHPADLEKPLVQGLSLSIAAHETVAVVNKDPVAVDAIISLVQRLYNAQHGEISFDGKDIEDLNLRWLRRQIGLVASRPFLLDATILDNIMAGGESATREQAIAAAQLVGLHDFIMALPQQYDTRVGMATTTNELPIVQQQLLALARALAQEPKILIVEELAEDIAPVQCRREMDKELGRVLAFLKNTTPVTTLVVTNRPNSAAAHRADKIVVVDGGRVVESGTHAELMRMSKGVYKSDYESQASAEEHSATPVSSRTEERGTPRAGDSCMTTSPFSSILDVVRLLPNLFEWTLCIVVACAMVVAAVIIVALVVSNTIMTAPIATAYVQWLQLGDQQHALSNADSTVKWYIASAVGALLRIRSVILLLTCLEIKVVTHARDLHYRALLHQSRQFFIEQDHSPNALTAQLNTQSAAVASVIGMEFGVSLVGVSSLAGAIVVPILTMHGVSAALWVLILSGVYLIIQRRLVVQHVRRKDPQSHFSSDTFVLNHLTHIRSVVALNLEEISANAFFELVYKPIDHREKHEYAFNKGLSASMLTALWAMVLWNGALPTVAQEELPPLSALSNTIPVAVALTTAMVVSQLCAVAMVRTAENYQSSAQAMACISALQASTVDDKVGACPSSAEGRIEFRDVTFDGAAGLKNISFTVEPGETVAICSTSNDSLHQLVDTLERLKAPLSGDVLFDRHDIQTLSTSWLRDQIGIITRGEASVLSTPSTPVLFPGTIAENISYGMRHKPSQRKVEAVATLVGANRSITTRPKQYDMDVSRNSELITNDLAQRLAIARVLIKDPRVLIIDETGLNHTEAKLDRYYPVPIPKSPYRTTIVLSHRVSTLVEADKICVIHEGRVAEQGTHHELLANGVLYRTLLGLSSVGDESSGRTGEDSPVGKRTFLRRLFGLE
jgi:ATP-binding cassette, subfamily B (MDR/TAP), member 1